MNRSAPRNEEQLFADAIARPVHARHAFLDEACDGDAVLHARLLALLVAHESPDSLSPDAPEAAFALAPEEKPDDWIGRYRLRQRIGEGGCGVVWLAEQDAPVRRRVALKVIKLGMDTREVVARFSAERQALARMDHPNIARVFDAGATDSGRPYFVMERVDGLRITTYCNTRALPIAARLELFLQVCQAVQHAHQKGIIHRDLKPSNILVTTGDTGAGMVKVIDFGIAKATEGRLVDGTLVTAFEQFIGTPAYMSPEQADTTGGDVDTRSDVYSLGVLLYELLTGSPPFDPQSLGRLPRDEIRRVLRDTDPPRPSARLATLTPDDRAELSRLHGTDAARLGATLATDLDWIVMKAIEKERARRYQSAAELAADIARHLNHEPVLARPPGAAYRLGKMIRRHRLAFAAAALIALTLVAATAVSAWLAVQAREAMRTAARERGSAEDLLTFMLDDLRAPLRRVGELKVLESVGNKSMAYFATRDAHEIDDATLRRHAKALTLIGQLRLDQARYDDAQQSFEAALNRVAAVAERSRRDTEAQYLRAQAEGWIGLLHRRRGQLDSANEWFMRQRETAAALAAHEPANVRWQRERLDAQHSLSAIALEQGKLDAARRSYLDVLPILATLVDTAPTDLDLKLQQADVVSALGSIAERSGDLAEAGRRFDEQVVRLDAVVRADPGGTHWRFKLGQGLSFQAGIQTVTGKADAARRNVTRARELLEALVVHDPVNRRWQIELATLELREAALATADGERERASRMVESARKAFEKLAAAEPSDPRLPARLSVAWRLTAEFRFEAGEADASTAVMRAIQLIQGRIRSPAATSWEIGEGAQAHLLAGRIAAARGDSAAALVHWQNARDALAPHLSGSRDWRLLDPAARTAAYLGNSDQARALVSQLNHCGYEPLQPWPAF